MNFVAAGIDPTEGPEVVRAYRQAQGYPWTVVLAEREILERYNVVSTAIKYAIDRQGIITFQQGYGIEDVQRWEQVFARLVER